VQLWQVASTTCTKHEKFCNKPKEVKKLFTCHKSFNISMTCGVVTSCNKISWVVTTRVWIRMNYNKMTKLWQGAMFNKLQWQIVTFNKLWFWTSCNFQQITTSYKLCLRFWIPTFQVPTFDELQWNHNFHKSLNKKTND
jgi:hypothetical protein